MRRTTLGYRVKPPSRRHQGPGKPMSSRLRLRGAASVGSRLEQKEGYGQHTQPTGFKV